MLGISIPLDEEMENENLKSKLMHRSRVDLCKRFDLKDLSLAPLPNCIAIQTNQNNSKKRRNLHVATKSKSSSSHRHILSLIVFTTLSFVATLHLTATRKVLITIPETPTTGSTTEEPSTTCLYQAKHLPSPRDRATPSDIKDVRFAVLDHISLEICSGMKKNFFETKNVPSRFQIEWARVCAIVFRELSEVVNEIDNHRERLADFNLKLKRRIKMFFIVPTLLLRKIKGDG